MLEVELLADYLVENSYASTTTGAYNLIPCMSDNWMSLVLEELEDLILEMRKEDKVKGKTRTPMYVGTQIRRGRVEKYRDTPDGEIRQRVIPASTKKVPDLTAVLGRRRQGMPAEPNQRLPKNYREYSRDPLATRHPHGGGEEGVPQGSKRGVKQVKGQKVKPHQTSVEKIKQKLRGREEAKQAYNRSSSSSYSTQRQYNEPTSKQLTTRTPKLNLPS
jgi:hypothetical protein